MLKIDVELGDRSYPIHIGFGSLTELGGHLADRFEPDVPVCLISDENVAAFYLDMVEACVRAAGFKCLSFVMKPGEASKNLQTASEIYDFLIVNKVPRGGVIVGLGGGVVGDIAAFVASTYKRGVPYVAVPTSLLSQVDSSVGGKTGVDHRGEKNIVGTFCQPRLVLIDAANLATLPNREMIAGMAEVVKYAVVFDRNYFTFVEENREEILNRHPDPLLQVVSGCCRMKAEVVTQDEFDEGKRHVLNFGHTLAHALEGSTTFRDYLHGEAVSVGMVVAAKVSCKLGRCSEGDAQRLERLLKKIGLPTTLDPSFLPELLEHLYADKKRVADKIRFVVCEGIGSAGVCPITPEDLVKVISCT